MTLQPNSNWADKNNASPKRPIYAINIDGTDEWLHDHVIASGTTEDFYKILKNITGIAAKYSPIRLEASIGSFTFELINDPAVNAVPGFWTLPELYRKKVILKAGYEGLAWSDFITIQANYYIQNISGGTGNTSIKFTVQDVQQQMKADVFTEATEEIPDVISSRNPMTLWMQIVMSTGDGTNWPGSGTNYDVLDASQGLGIPYAEIDIAEIELLRDDFIRTWEGEWEFTESVSAQEFFKSEIYQAFALTPVIKSNGTMSLRPILPPLPGYMFDNDMASILTDADLIEVPKWTMDFRDIVNRIEFNYDWNGIEYVSQAITNDSASQALFGERTLKIESKGITSTIGGTDLIDRISARYFRKFGNAPMKINIKTKFKKRIIEAADQLDITSSHIYNMDNGDFEWSSRVAEVESVSPDYKNGSMSFVLSDITVPGNKYGVIGPDDLPEFGGASDAQKARYCWIGSEYNIL